MFQAGLFYYVMCAIRERMGALKDKFKEVFTSTMPVIIVVFMMQMFLTKSTYTDYMLFWGFSVFVLAGLTFFLHGVDMGVNPVGNAIGSEIPKRKSRLFMILVIFAISFLVTVAEPNVSIFGQQVMDIYPSVSSNTIVYGISAGIAFVLLIAAIKIVYDLPLRYIFLLGWGAIIIIAFIAPEAFRGIAFDSGGVATGPMMVPVLLALSLGICLGTPGRSEMDSFGMVGLAAMGPVLALLLISLGIDGGGTGSGGSGEAIVVNAEYVLNELVTVSKNILAALIPLTIFFIFFQRRFLTYTWDAVRSMSIGLTYTGIGLILFLFGVYCAFIPVVSESGAALLGLHPIWMVLIGLVLGFLIVFAEPAVSILGDQVNRASNGAIRKGKIRLIISVAVGGFVALAMVKISFDLSILIFVVPGYVAILILMFYSDKDIIGIAFDSGGVATGPIAVAVTMALYTSISSAKYSGIEAVINGFGVVAFMAMAPTLFLMILGVIIKRRKSRMVCGYEHFKIQ